MKKFLKIAVSVIVIIVLLAAGGVFYITRGLDSGAKVEVNNVDLTSIKDGVYNGSYNSGRWTNELAVTVKDHKISEISIVKDVTFANPEMTQQLIKDVIEKQRIDLDAVSGATVTTKAYLKSVENALSK